MGIISAPDTAIRPLAGISGRRSLRYLRRAIYWLAVIGASVALLAVLASVGARLFGYSPYVMYGGSMGSAAPMGSVAIIEDVPAQSLKVGDVIVFRPPSSGKAREPLMHRIISIKEVDGQRVVRTKGDANESADPWELRLSGEGGRMVCAVPYVGYLLWFFQTRLGWVFVALPLITYLGFVALRRIWVPPGGRKAYRRQAW
ncbi:MAG: signal peptidase I [Dehalococcoidia bacterium]